MCVARSFQNIQLFLFNPLRAVLGMGMKMVLHDMDLINPVLAAVPRENQKTITRVRVRVRVVRVRGKGMGEGFVFRV
jgi:hypothetical protein